MDVHWNISLSHYFWSRTLLNPIFFNFFISFFFVVLVFFYSNLRQKYKISSLLDLPMRLERWIHIDRRIDIMWNAKNFVPKSFEGSKFLVKRWYCRNRRILFQFISVFDKNGQIFISFARQGTFHYFRM